MLTKIIRKLGIKYENWWGCVICHTNYYMEKLMLFLRQNSNLMLNFLRPDGDLPRHS
jgi:hypothetical protein